MTTIEKCVDINNGAAEIEKWRETLRQGKGILVVDDHQCSIDLVRQILSPYFQEEGAIDSETDPFLAIEKIAQKTAKAEIQVLVLDMDMPKMNGKEVLIALAKRNIFVPTVIFSGGQGNNETRSLLASLSSAKNKEQILSTVERMVSSNQGVALAYVGKETTVIKPDLLLNAVDAMLIAGERRVSNIELLLGVNQESQIIPSPDRLKKLYSRIADECLLFIYRHNRFTKEIQTRLLEKLQSIENSELRTKMEQKIKGLLLLDPTKYCFEELIKICDAGNWDSKRHRLLGSEGINGYYSSLENLSEHFEGVNVLFEQYKKNFFSQFYEGFIQAEDQLWLAFEDKTSVAEIVKEALPLSGNEGKCLIVEGEDFVVGNADNLISAIEEALANARHAIENKKEGKVEISFGKQEINDGEEVGFICIEDNGGGISKETVDAWENDGEIISTKTGKKACGLKIMKEIVKESGGFMSIDSGSGGTKIYFFFPFSDSNKSIN